MNQFETQPEQFDIPQPTLELTPEERELRKQRSAAHFARLAENLAEDDNGQKPTRPNISGGPLYLAPRPSSQGELDLSPENHQKLF